MKKHWFGKPAWSVSRSTIVLFTLTLIIVVGFVVFQTDLLSRIKPKTGDETQELQTQFAQSPIKVDFEYTVSAITAESIVLTGEKGDFTLPNNESSVFVFRGSSAESQKISLSSLAVGDILNLEFIPNQSAKLFLSETN